MQEKYALFVDVLSRFHQAGVLDHFILIGSWCLPVYQETLFAPGTLRTVRTRDIDFLVPRAGQGESGKSVDLKSLLESEGFIEQMDSSGIIRLEHPELAVEFLIPQRGSGTMKLVALREFGVNAQALRFLSRGSLLPAR